MLLFADVNIIKLSEVKIRQTFYDNRTVVLDASAVTVHPNPIQKLLERRRFIGMATCMVAMHCMRE